jgi:hypothetical protein
MDTMTIPRWVRYFFAALLIAVLTAPTPVTAAALPAAVRVMVVGDSISQGKTGDDPWRCQLWRKAITVMRVDMVGPRTDLHLGGEYGSELGCDPDHDAIWGSVDPLAGFVSTAKLTIAAEVTSAQPGVMLVLLGVNDVNHAHPLATIAADFTELVANARGANPNLVIVVGTVLPTNGVVDQAGIDAYNAWLVTNHTALGVRLVDTATVFDPVSMTYDGVHPTTAGSDVLARAFLPALLRRPQPSPPMPVLPAVTPSLVAPKPTC